MIFSDITNMSTLINQLINDITDVTLAAEISNMNRSVSAKRNFQESFTEIARAKCYPPSKDIKYSVTLTSKGSMSNPSDITAAKYVSDESMAGFCDMLLYYRLKSTNICLIFFTGSRYNDRQCFVTR